jgi:hypothetical protein
MYWDINHHHRYPGVDDYLPSMLSPPVYRNVYVCLSLCPRRRLLFIRAKLRQ